VANNNKQKITGGTKMKELNDFSPAQSCRVIQFEKEEKIK
jgi:hypothetical protein